MVSINIYAIYQSDLAMAVNNNVDNRTFNLSYPLDKNINALMDTFNGNGLIENLSYEAVEGFNAFIVTYTLYDYKDQADIDKQFEDFSDAISTFESNKNIESIFMFKIGKYIQLFLILTILISLALLNTVVVRILKDMKPELILLNAIGYNKVILFLISFIKVLLVVSMGFCFTFFIERLLIRELMIQLILNSSILINLDVKWYLTFDKSMLMYVLIMLIISIQLTINLKKRHAIGTFKDFD